MSRDGDIRKAFFRLPSSQPSSIIFKEVPVEESSVTLSSTPYANPFEVEPQPGRAVTHSPSNIKLEGRQNEKAEPIGKAESVPLSGKRGLDRSVSLGSGGKGHGAHPRKLIAVEVSKSEQRKEVAQHEAKQEAKAALWRPPPWKRIKLEDGPKPVEKVPVDHVEGVPVYDLDSTDEEDLEDKVPQAAVLEAGGPKLPASTSFLSTSSLSTLPSSQVSFVSASQRVWKGGEQMVTNSSSEHEDFDDTSDGAASDDSGMDEIERLISLKQQDLITKQEQQPLSDTSTEPVTRQSRRHKLTPMPQKSYPTPPKSNYRHSLEAILKKQKKTAALQSRLQQLEEDGKRADEQLGVLTANATDDEDSSTTGRASAAVEKLDDADGRLKLALDRMDALEHNVRFHFFNTTGASEMPDIPLLERSGLYKSLEAQDEVQKILFLTDVSYRKPQPMDVQQWSLYQILYNDSEEVTSAHVELLYTCAQHEEVSQLLSPAKLHTYMLRLGARADIVSPSESVVNEARHWHRVSRHNLRHFLDLVSRLTDKLHRHALCFATLHTSLILVDSTVGHDVLLVEQAKRTLCALLSGFDASYFALTVEDTIFTIIRHLDSPILMARLVSLLPTAQQHRQVALFARLLALTALLPAPAPKLSSLHDPTTWTLIHTLISDPFFVPERDFSLLSAKASLLSAAIGAGFAPAPFLPTDTPSTSTPIDLVSFFVPRQQPRTRSDEEKEADAAAQRVEAALKAVAAGMRDGGAAHVRKMEAKARVEGLAARVGSCIVVERRGKRVFG